MSSAPIGTIHHVELWVPDIDRAAAQWGWLLTELGYQPFQEWTGGCSWRLADTYIVIEQSPDMLAEPHDRKRPGLNHLAFHAGDQAQVDALTAAAAENGWALMFADKHPHAGGPQTYAAYLSNTDGHEVELTASNPVELTHPQVLTIPHHGRRRLDRDLQPARVALHPDHVQSGKAHQQVAAVAVGIVGVAARRAARRLGHSRGPRGQGVW